jgi:hypothetical protein
MNANTVTELTAITPIRVRLSQDRIPQIRCPICSADIDVSQAKYLEPLSTCHGRVVVHPVPGTLAGIVDFYT